MDKILIEDDTAPRKFDKLGEKVKDGRDEESEVGRNQPKYGEPDNKRIKAESKPAPIQETIRIFSHHDKQLNELGKITDAISWDESLQSQKMKEIITRLKQQETDLSVVEKLELRDSVARKILETGDGKMLKEFMGEGVLQMFDEWLRECHKKRQAMADMSGKVVNEHEEEVCEKLLSSVLSALSKLPVGLQELKVCKIGKSVNQLKNHKNKEIQETSQALVKLWKRRVDADIERSNSLEPSEKGKTEQEQPLAGDKAQTTLKDSQEQHSQISEEQKLGGQGTHDPITDSQVPPQSKNNIVTEHQEINIADLEGSQVTFSDKIFANGKGEQELEEKNFLSLISAGELNSVETLHPEKMPNNVDQVNNLEEIRKDDDPMEEICEVQVTEESVKVLESGGPQDIVARGEAIKLDPTTDTRNGENLKSFFAETGSRQNESGLLNPPLPQSLSYVYSPKSDSAERIRKFQRHNSHQDIGEERISEANKKPEVNIEIHDPGRLGLFSNLFFFWYLKLFEFNHTDSEPDDDSEASMSGSDENEGPEEIPAEVKSENITTNKLETVDISSKNVEGREAEVGEEDLRKRKVRAGSKQMTPEDDRREEKESIICQQEFNLNSGEITRVLDDRGLSTQLSAPKALLKEGFDLNEGEGNDKAPFEKAVEIPSPKPPKKPAFDFDLNEGPPMEEEDDWPLPERGNEELLETNQEKNSGKNQEVSAPVEVVSKMDEVEGEGMGEMVGEVGAEPPITSERVTEITSPQVVPSAAVSSSARSEEKSGRSSQREKVVRENEATLQSRRIFSSNSSTEIPGAYRRSLTPPSSALPQSLNHPQLQSLGLNHKSLSQLDLLSRSGINLNSLLPPANSGQPLLSSLSGLDALFDQRQRQSTLQNLSQLDIASLLRQAGNPSGNLPPSSPLTPNPLLTELLLRRNLPQTPVGGLPPGPQGPLLNNLLAEANLARLLGRSVPQIPNLQSFLPENSILQQSSNLSQDNSGNLLRNLLLANRSAQALEASRTLQHLQSGQPQVDGRTLQLHQLLEQLRRNQGNDVNQPRSPFGPPPSNPNR